MRIVIDANILISALWKPDSHPGRILQMGIEGTVELYAPDTVRSELERNLKKKLAYTDAQWRRTLEALPVEWLLKEEYEEFLFEAREAIQDASDAPVLAAALLVRGDVVTGDGDFHPLDSPLVKVWRPRDLADPSRNSLPRKARVRR